MRLYRQLWELKEAGINWRSYALQRSLSGTTRRPTEDPPKIVLENSPPQEPMEALLDATLPRRLQGRGGRWENN